MAIGGLESIFYTKKKKFDLAVFIIVTPNNYNMYGMLIMLIRGVLANENKVNDDLV